MNIHLHVDATTTPKTRRFIQVSSQIVAQLAEGGIAAGSTVMALPIALTRHIACKRP